MSGIQLINKGADYSAVASGLILPFEAAWEGLFILGTNAARSCINYVEGKPALSVVGSPLFDADGVTTTGNQTNFFQTAINHTADLTVVAIAKPMADGSAPIFSNYQSTSQNDATLKCIGTSLIFDTGIPADSKVLTKFSQGIWNGAASVGAEASTASPGIASVGAWSLISGKVNNAARTRYVNNWTNSESGTNSPAVNPADLGGQYRIGSTYNSQNVGSVKIALMMIFSEMLNDATMSLALDFARKLALLRNITV